MKFFDPNTRLDTPGLRIRTQGDKPERYLCAVEPPPHKKVLSGSKATRVSCHSPFLGDLLPSKCPRLASIGKKRPCAKIAKITANLFKYSMHKKITKRDNG